MTGFYMSYPFLLEWLDIGFAQGPFQIGQLFDDDAAEKDTPLTTVLPNDLLDMPPSGRLTAEIWPEGGEHLRFGYRFVNEGPEEKTEVSGIWEQYREAPPLDRDMPLQGWQVYRVERQENSESSGYRATPLSTQARTLAELLENEEAQLRENSPASSGS